MELLMEPSKKKNLITQVHFEMSSVQSSRQAATCCGLSADLSADHGRVGMVSYWNPKLSHFVGDQITWEWAKTYIIAYHIWGTNIQHHPANDLGYNWGSIVLTLSR